MFAPRPSAPLTAFRPMPSTKSDVSGDGDAFAWSVPGFASAFVTRRVQVPSHALPAKPGKYARHTAVTAALASNRVVPAISIAVASGPVRRKVSAVGFACETTSVHIAPACDTGAFSATVT